MLPSASCTCTYHARTVYGFDDGVYPLVVSENYDLPIGHHHAAALSVPVPGRDDSSIVLIVLSIEIENRSSLSVPARPGTLARPHVLC